MLLISSKKQSRQVMIPLMDVGLGSTQQQITQIQKRLSKPTPEKLLKLKDPSYISKIQKQSNLQLLCNRIDKRYPVLSPDSRFFLFWNILLAAAILFNFFQIPISVFLTENVYKDQFSHPQWIVINVIFLLAILFDTILIRPNLAYYEHGNLVVCRYRIVSKYLKFQVFLDVFSFLILLAYISLGIRNLVYLKIFFYFKFYSLHKADHALINYLQLHRVSYAIYLFFRIFLIMLFIVLWVASIYFAIDYAYYLQKGIYYQNSSLWLNDTLQGVDFIQELYWPYWLAYALYWASQIAATIGYGVVTARNPQTIFYSQIIMILMTAVFALFINTIWKIIGEMQESSENYYENWESLNKILSQKQISDDVNVRVSQYFHQIWKYNDNVQANTHQITQNLSFNLKKQLRALCHLHIFHGIPLFQNWESEFPEDWIKFKIQIFQLVQTQQLAQKQHFIIRKNTSNTSLRQKSCKFNLQDSQQDYALYFVLKGRIKIKIINHPSKMNDQLLYKVNERFGYEEFFMQKPLTYTAQADCFTRVCKITRRKFIQCLKQVPNLYYLYLKVILDLKLTADRSILGQHCWFCHGQHTPFKCPTQMKWRQNLIRKDPLSIKYSIMLNSFDKTQSSSKKTYRNLIKSSKITLNKISPLIPAEIDKIEPLQSQEQKKKWFKYEQKNLYNFI